MEPQQRTSLTCKLHSLCVPECHLTHPCYLGSRCTSLPLMALSTDDFWAGLGGLSQNMNIIYHAPAPL
jgi:hypothetical protein